MDEASVEARDDVRLEIGPWRFDAEWARVDLTTGQAELSDVTWWACGCSRPVPWSLHARAATWTENGTLVVRGAQPRVFGIPLLRVPKLTIPFERRSGFLSPAFRLDDDGLTSSVPLFLTHGTQADTTWTPEIRTARGARLQQRTRWALSDGQGSVQSALGTDWAEGTTRGGANWKVHQGTGPVFAATEGQWASDDGYLSDYRDGFLDRALPYTEQRALVGAGPFEAGARAVSGPSVDADAALLAARLPALSLPGGLLARTDVVGTAPLHPQAPVGLAGSASLLLSRPTVTRTFELRPHARARVFAHEGDGFGIEGSTLLDARLRLWRQNKTGVERWYPGLVAGMENEHPTALVAMAYRRIAGPNTVHLVASAGRQDAHWMTRLWSDMRVGPLVAFAQVEATVETWRIGTAGLDIRGDGFKTGLTVTRANTTNWLRPHASWRLPGLQQTFTVGAHASWRATRVRREAQVLQGWWQWVHPTGCLGITGSIARHVDQSGPGFALTLSSSPGNRQHATPSP